MLDIQFFFLVSRKGEVELQTIICGQRSPKIFVEEIGGAVPLAEEEPIFSRGLGVEPLLHEGAERGDAGPRADHDDVCLQILGEEERMCRLQIDRDGRLVDLGGLAEKGAGDAIGSSPTRRWISSGCALAEEATE